MVSVQKRERPAQGSAGGGGDITPAGRRGLSGLLRPVAPPCLAPALPPAGSRAARVSGAMRVGSALGSGGRWWCIPLSRGKGMCSRIRGGPWGQGKHRRCQPGGVRERRPRSASSAPRPPRPPAPHTAALRGSDCPGQADLSSRPSRQPPPTPEGSGRAGRRRKRGRVPLGGGSLGVGIWSAERSRWEEGGDSGEGPGPRGFPSRGSPASGPAPSAVTFWPPALPAAAAAALFPVWFPGFPASAPRPAPAWSLPSRRRGRGRGPGTPGLRARPGRCLLFRAVHSPARPFPRAAGPSGRRRRSLPVTDFAARSGRAAPATAPPAKPARTNHPRPLRAGPGPPRPPPGPYLPPPARHGQHGGSGAARRADSRDSRRPRPGPARRGSALLLLSPAPPSCLPPGGPGGSGVARGCRPPLASRWPGLGPSPLLPPASSPGPLLSARAVSSRRPAPPRTCSPDFGAGLGPPGSRDPACRAPGGRLPGLRVARAARRAWPPLAPAERTPGMPRLRSALLEGARPAPPALARAPQAGQRPAPPAWPRLDSWGKDGNRIWRLPGGGGGRGPGRLGLLPAGRSMGLGAGRGAAPLPEAGGVGGREPRLRRSLIIPSGQAHSQVFSLGFNFFFRCGTFCKLFFLTCKAVTTNSAALPGVGGGGRREGRAPPPEARLRRQPHPGLLGEGAGRASVRQTPQRQGEELAAPFLLPGCRPARPGGVPLTLPLPQHL